MNSAKPSTLFIDETISTDKGDLVVQIDFAKIMEDTEKFKDRLMSARGIPFNYINLSASDPLIIIASQQMTWTDDSAEIIREVQQHYTRLEGQARNDGAILAMTFETPDMDWEPEPYPEKRKSHRDWDINLPEPVINMQRPIERRLKQIIDMISSDASVGMRFNNLLESVFIEADRRSRKIEAETGFQPGRTDRVVSKKVKSGRVVGALPEEPARVGSVHERDGDSRSEE